MVEAGKGKVMHREKWEKYNSWDTVTRPHLSSNSVMRSPPVVQPSRVELRVNQWSSWLKQSHGTKGILHISPWMITYKRLRVVGRTRGMRGGK